MKTCGSIAQLGEHLPYKQRVTGSIPVVPTTYGPVAQLVRVPPCHGGGRGSESLLGRHLNLENLAKLLRLDSSVGRAEDWKSSCPWFDSWSSHQWCGSGSVVERHLAKVNVASSNLVFRSNYIITVTIYGAIAKR